MEARMIFVLGDENFKKFYNTYDLINEIQKYGKH